MKYLSFIILLVTFLLLSTKYSIAQDLDTANSQKSILQEVFKTTVHEILINGEKIKYTATAGNLLLKDAEDNIKGSIFFISYSRKGITDISSRPIAFVFNGGPGSSSIWLHMGMLGPKRVLLTDEGEMLPQPFKLVENEYSFLDQVDLVFIDPMLTGYSKPNKAEDSDYFLGVQEDIQSLGDFIHQYIKRYNRWTSPKYLIGESYGTFRSAGMAEYLQDRHGIYLSGLILISAVLDFQPLVFNDGNDLPFVTFLPGYAATAWYHKKLGENYQNLELPALLVLAEEFAIGEYATALLKGNQMSNEEIHEISNKISNFTGIPSNYIRQNNFRINASDFYREFLRPESKIVGRSDSRFTRFNHIDFTGPLDDIFYYDPSFTAVQGPFTTTFNDYLQNELEYNSEDIYEVFYENLPAWNPGEFQSRYYNTSTSLHRAMVKNPELKVFVAGGYYDLASPYYIAKYTFNHLFIDESLRKNILLKFYEGGHMMYIKKETLKQMKSDIDKFIEDE